MPSSDEEWMGQALRLARAAGRKGEVPIGAVVVSGGRLAGRGANRSIGALDPTAHAEVTALRRAARAASNYRIPAASLYVTLEPCLMCLGAMVHARIDRLVYGARDPKVGSTALLKRAGRGLNHKFSITGGVRGEECAALLREFFRRRRGRSRPVARSSARGTPR